MLCGTSAHISDTGDRPKQFLDEATYLSPSMSLATDLDLHPRRHRSELRIELLHRDAHAARASVIRAHAEPGQRRSHLVLRHILRWAAHAHYRARWHRAKRLG